jgi:hypothetical protein
VVAVAADLVSPPIGSVKNIPQALEALRQADVDQPGDGEPTGLLLKTASRPLQLEALNVPPLQRLALVRSAVQTCAAQGFTTVQNGLAALEQINGH